MTEWPDIPERCALCEDYYLMNPDLFNDCPACDLKAKWDEEERLLIILHLAG